MEDHDRNIIVADASSSKQIQEGFMNIERFKTLPINPSAYHPVKLQVQAEDL